MRLYKCTCGWSFVIGKKKVYGPIDHEAPEIARMQSLKEFDEFFDDCSRAYTRHRVAASA